MPEVGQGLHSRGFIPGVRGLPPPAAPSPQRSPAAPDHPPQHAPRLYLHIPASPSPRTNPTRRPASPSQSARPLPTSSPQQQAPRVGVAGGEAYHE